MKILPHDTELILTKSQEPVKIYFENSKEVMIHTEVICKKKLWQKWKK